MTDIRITGLIKHQQAFIRNTTTRYIGLVGGYGSGKTEAFCYKAIQLAYLNKGHQGLLCEPTYTMLEDVLVPKFRDIMDGLGIPYTYKRTPYPTFVLHFQGGDSKILLRSAENFDKLVGLNLAWFGVDEIDTCFNRKKNEIHKMWKVLISRLRSDCDTPQGFMCSTPEGFNFLYDFFVLQPAAALEKGSPLTDRAMIKARTVDNQYLPADYINDLMTQYPPNLLRAYLEGEFVNLNTTTVYDSFNRVENHFDLTLEEFEDAMGRGIYLPDVPASVNMEELHQMHSIAQHQAQHRRTPLHIGMDFNIGKCAAIVHVEDGIGPIAIDEIHGIKNTEEMIAEIKRRYPGRHITMYPDSSGASGKTNSSQTDIALLKGAGFAVAYNSKNPPVVDRINTMNAMFCNGLGERRYRVNVNTCPNYCRTLEQQSYKADGTPDKAHDADHPNDAAGYYIWKKWPLTRHYNPVVPKFNSY